MGISKRWTFMINYAIHIESSCTSKHKANCTSISLQNDISLQIHSILGLTCACTVPCMEDPKFMHTSISLPCIKLSYKYMCLLIRKPTSRWSETLQNWKPNLTQRNFSFYFSISSLNFNILSWSSSLNSLALHHHHISRSNWTQKLEETVMFKAAF
jgi:hypothetical protein